MITEIVTLNGEKISNTTYPYTGAFESNKKFQFHHLLNVDSSAKPVKLIVLFNMLIYDK